jgi:MYXO-CTERM domain-containing protein
MGFIGLCGVAVSTIGAHGRSTNYRGVSISSRSEFRGREFMSKNRFCGTDGEPARCGCARTTGSVNNRRIIMRSIIKAAAVAAVLALSPAAALAQDNTSTTVVTTDDTTNTQYTAPAREEDDSDFPWGLLGLLGLAGLLGRKREERDIHVDARKH